MRVKYKKAIIIFFGVLIIAGLLLKTNTQNIVLRYDDFILQNDLISNEVVATLLKLNIPLVLGVIPCNNDETLINNPDYEYFDEVKKAVNTGLFEIAQHGLTHENLNNGEFDKTLFSEQFRRLKKGKLLLDSIFITNVKTFIPPWNAYDENTLQALDSLGFKAISSALSINQPVTCRYINYYPSTIDKPETLLKTLKYNKNRDGTIVLLFHHYDFNSTFTTDPLAKLICIVNKMPNMKFTTIIELIKNNDLADAKRIAANMEINLLTKILKTSSMLQNTSYALLLRLVNLLFYIAIGFFLLHSANFFYE